MIAEIHIHILFKQGVEVDRLFKHVMYALFVKIVFGLEVIHDCV